LIVSGRAAKNTPGRQARGKKLYVTVGGVRGLVRSAWSEKK